MNSKKKKRCISCLLYYSVELRECPHCGYRTDNDFLQSYHDALPLCSIVGYLRIGRAVEISRNRITYIGLDTIKNKRVLIDEFFPYGYILRRNDGCVLATDSSYEDIIEQDKTEFVKRKRQVVFENGTVYGYHRLISKKLCKNDKKTSLDNITLRSIIGTRANQEDLAEFRIINQGVCAVLCDGMGGIKGGETASAECVRIMMEASDTVSYCDEGILPAVLQHQTIKADKYIASLQNMERERIQCGTTLLYVVIRQDRLYFSSVGDSHIYLLRNNTIQLLTEEHNYFADLMHKVENGEIEYEDAVNHPKREALTSYIGIGNLPKLHVLSAPILLNEGDHILLCSDGLYRTLSDDDIQQIITEKTTTEAAADALIRAVEDRNMPKQDNTTLILYKHTERRRK